MILWLTRGDCRRNDLWWLVSLGAWGRQVYRVVTFKLFLVNFFLFKKFIYFFNWRIIALQNFDGFFAKRQHESAISQWLFVQFSSVAQSCPTLCDPMNRSTPGLPVRHQLPEFTQTHIHRVSDAIQPSHPLSSPSAPAPNPSQHQSFPMSYDYVKQETLVCCDRSGDGVWVWAGRGGMRGVG